MFRYITYKVYNIFCINKFSYVNGSLTTKGVNSGSGLSLLLNIKTLALQITNICLTQEYIRFSGVDKKIIF